MKDRNNLQDKVNRSAILCIGENKDDYFIKLKNLIISIREFGGCINNFDKIVVFMGEPKKEYKETLEELGAQIIISTPLIGELPCNNKIRAIEYDLGYDWYIVLDHDVLVMNDFSQFLESSVFKAKPVDTYPITSELLKLIFEFSNVRLPSNRYVTTSTGHITVPHYNSGVLLIPSRYRQKLYERWLFHVYNILLIREGLQEKIYFLDQIALTIAIQELGIDVMPLPVEMNFHSHIPVSNLFDPELLTPYIIHYHHCVNLESGVLTRGVHSGLNKEIDRWNTYILSQNISSM